MNTKNHLLKTILMTQVEILGRLDRLEQLTAKNNDAECIDHVDVFSGAYDSPRMDALNTLVQSLEQQEYDEILSLLDKLQGQTSRYT